MVRGYRHRKEYWRFEGIGSWEEGRFEIEGVEGRIKREYEDSFMVEIILLSF